LPLETKPVARDNYAILTFKPLLTFKTQSRPARLIIVVGGASDDSQTASFVMDCQTSTRVRAGVVIRTSYLIETFWSTAKAWQFIHLLSSTTLTVTRLATTFGIFKIALNAESSQ